MNKPNTTTRLNVPGFFSWDAMDEECLREGAALKRCFHTTAIKGTPKRKAKVAGGPQNRKRRAALGEVAN
jgi:hypothetical protein